MTDPDLIVMRAEMALIIARIEEILKQWGDGPPDMEELADAVTSMGEALRAGDLAEAQDEYLRLVDTFQSSRGQWAVWREITRLIEQRRKLAVTELGRLEALGFLLTAQQALAMLASVADAIDRALGALEIPANQVQRVRQVIAADIRALVNRQDVKRITPDAAP